MRLMLDGKKACLGGQLSLSGLGVSLGLPLKASDTHFNNGPFSFQQWTIFILTMDHCLDECQSDSRLMRAGLEVDEVCV